MTPAPRVVIRPTFTPQLDAAIEAQARRMARGDQALADDLAQEGRIGAWQALDRYDPTRGVPATPYALYWSRLRMITALRGTFEVAAEADVDAEADGDQGAQAERADAALDLARLTDGLGRRDRLIVRSLLAEASPAELARELGCSPRWARVMRRRLLARLRARAG